MEVELLLAVVVVVELPGFQKRKRMLVVVVVVVVPVPVAVSPVCRYLAVSEIRHLVEDQLPSSLCRASHNLH